MIYQKILFIVSHRIAEIHIFHLPAVTLKFVAHYPVEILLVYSIVCTVTITATATDGSGVYDSAIVYVSDDAGVNDIHIDNKPQNNTIYDLYGRKRSTPTKGINIINGKKVIIYN